MDLQDAAASSSRRHARFGTMVYEEAGLVESVIPGSGFIIKQERVNLHKAFFRVGLRSLLTTTTQLASNCTAKALLYILL